MTLEELNDPAKAYNRLSTAIHLDAIFSESYLETAIKHWLDPLPDAAFPDWHATMGKLASILKENHRDRWLEDFLSSTRPSQAMKLLRSAIANNEDGDHRKAEKDARAADRLFKVFGNLPGMARSRFELVYALHRQFRGHQCLVEGLSGEEIAKRNSYSWIQVQLLIETSICQGLVNNFGREGELIHQARQKAIQFHYPALQLRALGIAASFDTSEGRLKQSWNRNEAGLKEFWSGPYQALRGYQFYSGLEFAVEQTGDWQLAAALQLEAVAVVEETTNLDFRASAHFELGTAADMAGNSQTASEQFELARTLFKKLPANETTRSYEDHVEIALAELEAYEGKTQSAIHRLAGVHADIGHIHNFNVQLSYWKARAAVERLQGNMTQERICLEKVVTIARQGFSSLSSEKERWDWRRVVGPAFWRLLDMEISRPHDSAQALADWEAVHAGESRGNFSQAVVGNRRNRGKLLRLARSLRDSTLISFAVFKDKVVAWAANSHGVSEFMITAEPAALQREIKTFYALCSQEDSSTTAIKASATLLYKGLFEPLEEALRERHTLFIEADGPLSNVPWAPIVAASENLPGESYSIVNTPGLLYEAGRHKQRSGREDQVLVVVPGAVTFQDVQYQPLPDAEREAQVISGLYRKVTCLRGRDAGSQRILSELPKISIFHFAGHAQTYEYGGGLLLSGDRGQILSAADLEKASLNKCRLVVLSACSTATAEGEVIRDPNGLVRAFLASGATRVIASHWDVSSKPTGDLMDYFYQGLHSGQSVDEALKMARKKLRTKFAHPYYWASFEAFGKIQF